MKAVSLISVGIDSPVATYLMKKKGVDITGISFLFGTPEHIDALKSIKAKIGLPRLLIMDMTAFHKAIPKDERYRCILCKRFMYRVAERAALEMGGEAIITGENLGQVASQTLRNMETIDASVTLPVLRPLLCYDKNETIMIAREIGTFDISIKHNGMCPAVPDNPATSAALRKILEKEAGIDMGPIMDEAIAGAKVF